ncbi:hypothetical protein NDU88_001737 [Pleurodeles waltl]|uniref:Uncharacterized protein n=1 Tax=Pleurodeles waltl TaxID=8319 RepID=A0AAV7U8T0_PLEWA|nr:hypothetical protein NDU88_001737 [Pleurodeles waltl]
MPKMAPRPPGPAPAPLASGEMCGSPYLARSAASPRPLRSRMERAEAGRAMRKRSGRPNSFFIERTLGDKSAASCDRGRFRWDLLRPVFPRPGRQALRLARGLQHLEARLGGVAYFVPGRPRGCGSAILWGAEGSGVLSLARPIQRSDRTAASQPHCPLGLGPICLVAPADVQCRVEGGGPLTFLLEACSLVGGASAGAGNSWTWRWTGRAVEDCRPAALSCDPEGGEGLLVRAFLSGWWPGVTVTVWWCILGCAR